MGDGAARFNDAEFGLLIGVLSDSHGRFRAVRKALDLFDRLSVAHVIHCGDVGGVEVFDELADRSLTFVWGNTDFPDDGLLAYLRTVGIATPTAAPTCVELNGKRFAVFHGHEREFDDLSRIEADFVLHGHTHVARDEVIAGKRVINPGALHRAAKKTVATIDTVTGRVDFHQIAGI
jgi:putative phosphoesterase